MGELAALDEALLEKQRHEAELLEARLRFELRRDASLFALLCNLLGGGKKTWTEEDFLPKQERGLRQDAAATDEEAREAIEAYRARVAAGRKKRPASDQ